MLKRFSVSNLDSRLESSCIAIETRALFFFCFTSGILSWTEIITDQVSYIAPAIVRYNCMNKDDNIHNLRSTKNQDWQRDKVNHRPNFSAHKKERNNEIKLGKVENHETFKYVFYCMTEELKDKVRCLLVSLWSSHKKNHKFIFNSSRVNYISLFRFKVN